MNRIETAEVLRAYASTGATPLRGCFVQVDADERVVAGCAMTAVALHRDRTGSVERQLVDLADDPQSLMEACERALGLSTAYALGFEAGFDGKDPRPALLALDHFRLGLEDGRGVRCDLVASGLAPVEASDLLEVVPA